MEIDTRAPNEIVKSERENKTEIKVTKNPNNVTTSQTNINYGKSKTVPRKRRIFRKRLGWNIRNSRRTLNRNNRNNSRTDKIRNGQANSQNKRTDKNNVRLLVRNLTKNVNNSDLQKMFEKVGPLKRCGIHYTSLGDSKGVADIEYLYNKDTYKALRQLDFKNLKGVPIRLEIKGGNTKKKGNPLLNRRKGGIHKNINKGLRRRLQRNDSNRYNSIRGKEKTKKQKNDKTN